MSYWKNYWNKVAAHQSPQMQVQRDRVTKVQMDIIEKHICTLLDLQVNDALLDVCCGNGLVTARLAKHCKQVVGVDFSKPLIENAQALNKGTNTLFIEEDATQLSNSVHQKFDKIILYFSFQYFGNEQGGKVIAQMKKLLKPGGKILLGDIPDQKYFWAYYDTFLKRLFYFKQWVFGQSKMGKFWSEQELVKLADQNGFKGKVLAQPHNLPHAHYRLDFLMEKK